jgi:hypothetical protein
MELLYVTVVPVDFAVLVEECHLHMLLRTLYSCSRQVVLLHFLLITFYCMHVGVGDPSHLHTGNKIFELLYIICDLFCAAVLCHFEMRCKEESLN